MQPIIGAWSDRTTSRFGRRRPFIVGSTIIIVFSLFLIALAKEISGSMPWVSDENSKNFSAVMIVVVGFYLLDFAINAVQASSRALIVDVAPLSQQDSANAWARYFFC